MRNIIESKWQSFGALHHTIQSMAAACLAKDFPHLASMAATEHSRALTSVRGTLPSAELYEAKLIVYTMLGHTASWLDPHNLATDIFRDTYKAVKEMPSDDSSNSRRFFSGTLDYWAMLLAYLTDCEDLGDYEPGTTPITKPTASERIDPHPYSGLSQETVQIVTEIGILIFQYRKRMSTIKFLLEEHLDTFREALRKARRLERSLLAHRLPELTQVHDTGDPKTPLSHLQAIDEAYRCTGLLQLYRVFPDLLNERYAPWSKEYILRPVPAEKVPTAKERRIWLTELAKHILSILQEIPFESSTRCVQPFIMVALSSELEHESSGHPLDGFGVDQSSVEVSRARNFICSRLAAYWHILPLQKVKVIFELIKCIWAALDSGKKDVYWLDVAYERSLATMMG
ncbi:hypothetical protein BU24DRAFT_436597 [Aaosphaeria arxii CBS 175.79]|uniref:C6 zinc finger domain-containing protein n=1 Tax=Aaosphaeria arxii CBS 175.79 TaxID=1450172 RepID=A0A6A5XC32_9PLEO|nr:uncharacterized protein BU24DRAFT_436597 [Aaosphaeria arxii CBS 175.79]KAF2010480.1 hypothetical protein BU24DRAFT_436597 [Aaosphaeria arxii CBS 175.79]